MKRTIKKAIAVLLAFVLTCGFVTCFAAEGKEYYDYGTYVLLGESGILGADNGSFAPESEVNMFALVGALLRSAFADSANIFRLVRTLSLTFNLIKSCGIFNLTNAVSRAHAAQILVKFSSL